MKVAVITGAGSGIGLALSLVYLQQGVTVVMVDKDCAKLKNEAMQLVAQFPGKVVDIHCDVTDEASVKNLVEQVKNQLGRVDWIYNNAGIIGNLAPIWDIKPEQIRQVMDVNLFGMIHIIQAFTPLLFQQNHHAHIVNMASLYALCSGSQLAAYTMSKHAVLALSESLHFDLKRLDKPVDVSVVFPSFTDTSLLSNPAGANSFHEALKKLLTYSRPASDVATHIAQSVEKKQFYILPDKEVKGYCEERVKSIVLQESPHINNIEKLMKSLMKNILA
ncbi:MAG: SDR family NAD(P)-dependent oxidoreductase [Legionellales bacterium]